ncbi:MAG: hypothetical protein CR977_01745, partial [Gammaproteobacteria bacterium]
MIKLFPVLLSLSALLLNSGLSNTALASDINDLSNNKRGAVFMTSFEGTNAPILAGCQILPQNNIWNTAIDNLPVHENNAAYISSVGGDTPLHADFGTVWQNTDIGIPYNVIPNNQAFVPIKFDYWDESDLNANACDTNNNADTGCYPIPANPNIEG